VVGSATGTSLLATPIFAALASGNYDIHVNPALTTTSISYGHTGTRAQPFDFSNSKSIPPINLLGAQGNWKQAFEVDRTVRFWGKRAGE
jgi:hypothetical protein